MNVLLNQMLFSYACALLLSFIFYYIYRTSKLKYFKRFFISCFIFSTINLVDIVNIQFVNIHFRVVIITVLQILGLVFVFLGLYDYGKKEIKKTPVYISISVILIIVAVSSVLVHFIGQHILLEFLFGLVMIFAAIGSFYYFRKTRIGKYIIGIACLVLGVIYIRYCLNGGWNENEHLSDFLESLTYTLIGVGILVSYFEVTKKELEINQERMKSVEEASNDGFWEYDILNNTIYLSQKTLNLVGQHSENFLIDLEQFRAIIHPEDLNTFDRILKKHILGKSEYYKNEYRIKSTKGNYKYFLSKGKTIFNEKSDPIKILGSHTDITEIKNREEKIYNLAHYDQITGLPNRSYFKKKLTEVLYENNSFSVLAVGLVGFKDINDALGHDCGDIFLKIIGNEIKKSVPSDAELARFKEDQFVVMVKNYDTYEIKRICDKILDNLQKPMLINNNKFYVSGNIGISLYPKDSNGCKDLIKNADLAMHKAKEIRNSYKFFDNFMNEEIQKKVYLEKSLYEAVERNEFIVYYQLQKDIVNNIFSGAEALVRWEHADKGFISPDEFIPLSEETGLIVHIGEVVLREACYKAKKLHEKGYKEFSISVNITDGQLRNGNFLELVKDILIETKFNPKYLTLEITEGVFMKSLEENVKILSELRKLGISIALDDFGTGYSSLNYLLKLPIDILKIDKSFIEGIEELPKKESVLAAIISIAKEMDLSVVVEGVESEEQLEIIRNLSCHKIQGYLFSKPAPEIEKYLLGDMTKKII